MIDLARFLLSEWFNIIINFPRLNPLEWVACLIPVIAVAIAIGGIIVKGRAFTSSLYWRITCIVLPFVGVEVGPAIYVLCKLIGYDNGSTEGFRPDNFAFGCFIALTPAYILAALLLSLFAKGIRVYALPLNIFLAIAWYVAVTNIRM